MSSSRQKTANNPHFRARLFPMFIPIVIPTFRRGSSRFNSGLCALMQYMHGRGDEFPGFSWSQSVYMQYTMHESRMRRADRRYPHYPQSYPPIFAKKVAIFRDFLFWLWKTAVDRQNYPQFPQKIIHNLIPKVIPKRWKNVCCADISCCCGKAININQIQQQ